MGPFGFAGLEALGMGARSPLCRGKPSTLSRRAAGASPGTGHLYLMGVRYRKVLLHLWKPCPEISFTGPPIRYGASRPESSYTGPPPSARGQYAYKVLYRTPLPLRWPKMRLQTTKSVQNGPKWPLRAFRARQWPFWVIFGAILELRYQQHSRMCPMVLKWKPLRPVFVLCWLYFRHFSVFWVFWGPVEPF